MEGGAHRVPGRMSSEDASGLCGGRKVLVCCGAGGKKRFLVCGGAWELEKGSRGTGRRGSGSLGVEGGGEKRREGLKRYEGEECGEKKEDVRGTQQSNY